MGQFQTRALQHTSPLFDHFVGAQKRCGRYVEAKHFGRLEVDDEFEFRRLLERQFGRFGAFEYLVDENACAAEGARRCQLCCVATKSWGNRSLWVMNDRFGMTAPCPLFP